MPELWKTLTKDIRLKSGDVLVKGTKVSVKPIVGYDRGCTINNGIRDYRVSYSSVFKVPSENCIEHAISDGVCSTPAGCRTEPDGYDHYGFPSWLLVMGMI